MASKRVTKSAIDWSRLQKLLPQDQQYVYNSLLGKNYQYLLKVASLPENLPKIDFEAYKKQLANPSAIEKLEKGYLGLQVAYPKDSQNLLSKVNQAEKDEDAKLVAYLKEVAKTIESLKAEKFKLTNIPPLEQMTKELEVYYFPDKADKHLHALAEVDLYTKMAEDKKKGHKHH